MSSSLVKSQSNTLTSLKNNRSVKLLVFKMGKLNLALSIDYVQKVINHIPVYGSGTNHVGIIHLEDKEITVVDLQRKLFKVSQNLDFSLKTYLIIARNSSSEQIGIVVSETPSLLEVPISQIRVLPESYRRADTLEFASHVTIIEQKEQSLTVFLLDVDRLI
jgi:purine-binding chemotaxis protein CheW